MLCDLGWSETKYISTGHIQKISNTLGKKNLLVTLYVVVMAISI
jgi:hypothetical protein